MTEALRTQHLDRRFLAACLDASPDPHCQGLHAAILDAGLRLARAGLAPPGGGSLSVQLDHGFAITCHGCHLPATRRDELLWVRECDLDNEIVRYVGAAPPPVDAVLHHRILASRPDCGALVHAHSLTPLTTRRRRGIREVPDAPGDPLTLALAVLEQIEIPRAPVLVGRRRYIAGARTLCEAVTAVVDLHRELSGALPT
jgi:hypothetical protein